MKMFRWVKNNLWYYRIFIEWTIPTLVLIFCSIIILFFNFKKEILIKDNIKKFFQSSFFHISITLAAPAIILMIVVLTISFLFFPIVHFRSLIVIFPNLVLYGSILPTFLNDLKKYKIFFTFFLIFLTFVNSNYYFKNMIYTHQNIEWVVKKTFTKNCANIPVYFNDNGSDKLSPLLDDIIFMYSKYKRPILSLTELNINKYKSYKKYYGNKIKP